MQKQLENAFIEDMYFLHVYQGYYYGYRNNKCFKFNMNTDLVDVFDVEFPYQMQTGSPVFEFTCGDAQMLFFGIQQQSGYLFRFYAHSIHRVIQIKNVDLLSIPTMPYATAVVQDGLIVYDTVKSKLIHLKFHSCNDFNQNNIEYIDISTHIQIFNIQIISFDSMLLVFQRSNPGILKLYSQSNFQHLKDIKLHKLSNYACQEIVFHQQNIIIMKFQVLDNQDDYDQILVSLHDFNNITVYTNTTSKYTNFDLFDGSKILNVNNKYQMYTIQQFNNCRVHNAQQLLENTFQQYKFKFYLQFNNQKEQLCKKHTLLPKQLKNEIILENDYQIQLLNSRLQQQDVKISVMQTLIGDQNQQISSLQKDNELLKELMSKQMNITDNLIKQSNKMDQKFNKLLQ